MEKKLMELSAQIADLSETSERLSGEQLLVDAEHTKQCLDKLHKTTNQLTQKVNQLLSFQ